MAEKKARTTTRKKPIAAAPEPTAVAAPPTPNGLAISALVVGIVAFISGWAPFWGFITGVAAVILGIIGLKKQGGKGLSIAGIVLGGVGALWSIVMSLLLLLGLIGLGAAGGELHKAVRDANQSLAEYSVESQELIKAAQAYSKGETARFGYFEVTANSVTRNYTTQNNFLGPEEGNELIVVNITAKNVGSASHSLSRYDLRINIEGAVGATSYLTTDDPLKASNVAPDDAVTGDIIFEIPAGATALKLQYETYAYDFKQSGAKKLTYTLAL